MFVDIVIIITVIRIFTTAAKCKQGNVLIGVVMLNKCSGLNTQY